MTTSSPVRVLLVDDQPLLRAGLRIVVDSEPGLSVVAEAGDGEQAIALARTHVPDVVLMDIRMPGTDGIEATARIVADQPSTHVIMLTTFDIDEYVYDAIRAGASGFLLKDAGPEALIDAIRTVAGGDAVLAPTATRRLISQFAEQRTRSPEPEQIASLDQLTDREREVFLLIARGLSNKEIGADLNVAENTVKVHVGRVLGKLELRDRVQAVILAYESGLAER